MKGARAVLVLGLLAILGCRSTWYDEYRAQHPGFDPTLPRTGASLLEVLAALHAPNPEETIDVSLSRLAIFHVLEGGRWREIPFEALRDGRVAPAEDEDYAVLFAATCVFAPGLSERVTTRRGYFLLEQGRVSAYDHYAFRDRCAVDNEFLAARGAQIPVEREAFARLGESGATFSLVQAYRRGLAYLEAGRLAEARAMLLIGERSYRASVQRMRAAGGSEALADAERMRAALMRALGVEPQPGGTGP